MLDKLKRIDNAGIAISTRHDGFMIDRVIGPDDVQYWCDGDWHPTDYTPFPTFEAALLCALQQCSSSQASSAC